MKLEQFKDLIQGANLDDMTQVETGGGFEYPVGGCVARLVEYVEHGTQARKPYQGVARDPAPEFHLGFALYSQGFCKDDGTPRIYRTFGITMSRNDKSRSYQMFQQMNWTKKHTHFAQMLGDAILVSFVESQDKQGKTRAFLDLKSFLAPVDPVSRRPYDCPAATDDLFKLFLWDNPTKETWESIHIDKDDNWMQDKCMQATNYPGSPLESMLLQIGGTTTPTVPPTTTNPSTQPVAPTVAVSGPINVPLPNA